MSLLSWKLFDERSISGDIRGFRGDEIKSPTNLIRVDKMFKAY